jgi:membrane-bound acyltransferase YfiQ involved in biofilm formation
MKQCAGKYTHVALSSSILILYLFSWYVYSLNITGITSDTPLRFLVYFLFGIYVNDNYKQISEFLEGASPKKFVLLGLPIVILPFYLMFYWIDFRFHTQFTNYVTHYIQLSLIVEGVLYISLFVMFLYLVLHYKPQMKILHEVGNYSFGIYLIHAIFHNMLITYILPALSISNSDLVYYVILFSGMALSSFYSVKLMSKHKITNFILTGKLQHATV